MIGDPIAYIIPRRRRLVGNAMNKSRAEILNSWIASEHVRLHVVQGWPDSDRKQVVLLAIRRTLQSLTGDPDARIFPCSICRSVSRPSLLRASRRAAGAEIYCGVAA
jgi:hypothetical protein